MTTIMEQPTTSHHNTADMANGNMPLVTAIITTCNRLSLLKRAVDSVTNQTYPNIQLVVVDDASADGTADYCATLHCKYIRIADDEPHGGNYARNKGIRAANGDYVAFLDDDDYWKPEKIAEQVAMAVNDGCDVVYCLRTMEYVGKDGISYVDETPRNESHDDLPHKVMYTPFTVTSCYMYRREALMSVGLFDEQLRHWQEHELSIRLAQQYRFGLVNKPLVVYRVDVGDKHRKTNNYGEWNANVKYIHEKHRELYKRLDRYGRWMEQRLVCENAHDRCKANGMMLKASIYHLRSMVLRYLIGKSKPHDA